MNTSLENTLAVENEGLSYISQSTQEQSQGYKFNLKRNLNRNKLQATCREYKHLDDEWKFDVDELQLIEAENGNVFHEPNPPKTSSDNSSPVDFDLSASSTGI